MRPVPVNGSDRGVLAPADTEGEWRKRITAELLASPTTITIDNAVELDSASIAVVLTGSVWRDRVLGRSEMVSLPSRAVWSATGTNIELSAEIARRSILSRQDAHLAEPWRRSGFRHPELKKWVVEHRADVVWAVLTLVRAWLAAGRPPGGVTLGGFEQWAAVIRGILDFAEIPGLLGNLSELHESPDPEDHAWEELVCQWWLNYQGEKVGVHELWALLQPGGQMPIDLELGPGQEKSQRICFGKRLGKLRDKVIAGYQIVPAGKRQRAQQWQLKSVAGSEP